MTTPSIDPHQLTRTAFDILVADLMSHGNTLSPMHRAALMELVDTFTGYITGHDSGRKAFGLPTGMGKTSAVVAFLTALHRSGHMVPVAVAASKVEALCSLKRELVAHGVPADVVGLKHGVNGASLPSTGSESFPFQLVTHARVRSGRDFQLFGQHQGKDRALCIYDETLMRSDSFAFEGMALRQGIGALAPLADNARDPVLPAVLAYLQECSGMVQAALTSLRGADGDPHSNGAEVELPFIEEDTLLSYQASLLSCASRLRGWAPILDALLAVSQESLRVQTVEGGGGIISVREAVPRALRNIVILDASTPIRQLARLDPTVTPVESFPTEALKSFEKVEIHQLLTPGSRTAIEGSYKAAKQETAAVSKEVADIVKAGWKTERAFLVFSFISKGDLDLEKRLRQDLAGLGVNLAATVEVQINGETVNRPRVEFLTWGQHEGLNGYEHCTSVIMAGVLHRSHLDLAAATKGQTGNVAEPTPNDRLRELIESEISHCLYQGGSRGACRRVVDGLAEPMRLWEPVLNFVCEA